MRITKSDKIVSDDYDRRARFVVGKDFNTKDWWVYDDTTDSKTYYFDTEEEANDFVETIINLPNYSDTEPYGGYKPVCSTTRINRGENMRIIKSDKRTVKASNCVELSKGLEVFLEDVAQSVGPFDYSAFMDKCWTSAAIRKIKQLQKEWNDYAEDDEVAKEIGADIQKVLDGLKSKSVDACGDIKASKRMSANDQALQHIKAAIDILGKSGMKDAVTKDSIANLGVVMFDLKSKR